MINNKKWITALYKTIITRSFIFGVIIPFVIYLTGCRYSIGIIPSLISVIYSCSYVLLVLIIKRKMDFFGISSLIVLTIILLAIIIAKDDKYYIYKGLIDEIILFFIFGISLLFNKPIMQIIVEKVNEFSDEIKGLSNYKRIWKIETIIWLIYYFIWFVVQIILMKHLSKQIFIVLQAIISKLSFFGLLAFSFNYSYSQIRKSYSKEIGNKKEAN